MKSSRVVVRCIVFLLIVATAAWLNGPQAVSASESSTMAGSQDCCEKLSEITCGGNQTSCDEDKVNVCYPGNQKKYCDGSLAGCATGCNQYDEKQCDSTAGYQEE